MKLDLIYVCSGLVAVDFYDWRGGGTFFRELLNVTRPKTNWESIIESEGSSLADFDL